MDATSWRSGALLMLLGAFLISRTVWHDDTGRTLVDRIMGKKPAAKGSSTTSSSGSGLKWPTSPGNVLHDAETIIKNDPFSPLKSVLP